MLMPSRWWRRDAPPVGRVVEVWYGVSVILAVWDGSTWRTTEGAPLGSVTHWRERG